MREFSRSFLGCFSKKLHITAKNNRDAVKIKFDVLEEAGYNIGAYLFEVANHSAVTLKMTTSE